MRVEVYVVNGWIFVSTPDHCRLFAENTRSVQGPPDAWRINVHLFVEEPRLKYKHLARDWQTSVAQASVRDCSGRSVDTYPRPHLLNIAILPHPIIARGVLEECAGKPGLRSCMKDQPSHPGFEGLRIRHLIGEPQARNSPLIETLCSAVRASQRCCKSIYVVSGRNVQ